MADAAPATAPTSAIGYTQAPTQQWWLYENETTPELQWPQSVFVYDQMRRTDSQCKAVLKAVMLPVLRTPWRIDPAGARPEVVQLVSDDLGLPIVGQPELVPARQKGRFSWTEHLRHALLALVFGHAYFEVVYRVEDDGSLAHLAKLEYRPPTTIERIDVAKDGGLVAIKQYWSQVDSTPQPIPVNRLVAYVNEREGGNWLGQSLLRAAYKNWLLKDRLLRVQAQTIERNGMGIPKYKAQEGASEGDMAKGAAMAQALRAGEAAGMSVPAGADIELMGVSGTLPDAKPVIDYHDDAIARAVLAHFLNLGGQTGSWALGATLGDFFTLSLQTVAQFIADTATRHIIEDLVDVNFGPDEAAPRLCFDEIGTRQQPTAEAVASLVAAGIIHSDATLEGYMRQVLGAPPAAPDGETPAPEDAGTPDMAVPDAPTQTGEYSVAASAGVDLSDEASWIAAAAGVDTHPGGERLKRYWLFGAGAAKWATWTELYDHLRKYIENTKLLKATVSKWYRLRYGHNPPRHHVTASALSASDEARAAFAEEFGVPDDADDESEDWDLAIDALSAALDELSGVVVAAFNADLHPRNPKGGPGGGRFRSTVDRLKDALTEHRKSGGESGDPFEGFDREQLRRAAVKQGIKLDRGEPRDSIAKKLVDHVGGAASAESKPAKKATPKKAAKKPAKPSGFESRLAAADKDARALDAVPITLRTDRSARLEGQLPDGWTRARHTAAADALEEYQGGSYATINSLLRSGRSEDYVQEWIDGVDDAMSISKLPRDTLVYRGIRRPEVVFGAAWKDSDSKVGLTWTDNGFTSTTVDRRVVDDPEFSGKGGEDAAIFRIVAPAGTSAIRLSDMAPQGEAITDVSQEAEVLLDRGLTFRVVADHGYDGSGKRILDVEVVPA